MLTLRDYGQDFDALLLAKPPRLTVEMLTCYQDHVAKVIAKNISDAPGDVSAEVEDAEDQLT